MSVFGEFDQKSLDAHMKFLENHKEFSAALAEELIKIPDLEAAGTPYFYNFNVLLPCI